MYQRCGFESQHHILNGHFPHLLVVQIVMFVEKDEIKWKRGREGPFKNPVLILITIIFFASSAMRIPSSLVVAFLSRWSSSSGRIGISDWRSMRTFGGCTLSKISRRLDTVAAIVILNTTWLVKSGSGCGTVDSVVAFDTRGPRFETSHWQLL